MQSKKPGIKFSNLEVNRAFSLRETKILNRYKRFQNNHQNSLMSAMQLFYDEKVTDNYVLQRSRAHVCAL